MAATTTATPTTAADDKIPTGYIDETTWHVPYKNNIAVAKRHGPFGYWKIYLYRGESPAAWKGLTFTSCGFAVQAINRDAAKASSKLK